MKKLLFIFCCAILVFALVSCITIGEPEEKFEETSEEGTLTFQLSQDGSSYIVSGFIGEQSSVEIPSQYNGLPVSGIKEQAFNGAAIKNITIPESIQEIGSYSFANCETLEKIVIPDNVTGIGDYAFSMCTALTDIVIPDNVITIGEAAFSECTMLEKIVIPDNVTSIGDYAFFGCKGLTSITIPASVTSIGDSAFHVCSSLADIMVSDDNIVYKSIEGNLYSKDGQTLIQYAMGKKDASFIIPDSVTSIGVSAFSECTNLTAITISDNVTSIGDYAFWQCTRLTSVTLGSGITSIGWDAFAYDNSITSVYISDIASWCEKSFSGSTPLEYAKELYIDGNLVTDLVIPDGVTSIDNAFQGSPLTSVTIPESVTSINGGAFANCTILASIKYRGTEAQWHLISKGTNWNYYTGLRVEGYAMIYNYTGE